MNEDLEIVLVTGSSGFIGSSVTQRLSQKFLIVGFDQAGPPHPPPQAECVCVDISSPASIKQALKRVKFAYGNKIATIVHLAAYYDFSGEPSDKYEEVTVQGTANLLDALSEFEVQQFVFSSTTLVHAPCNPGERITEDWTLDPKWDYPESKVRTERVILNRSQAIPSLIMRVAGVYDDWCHSIPLAHQIQRIYERQILAQVFPGDTSHGQPFVHLDDLVNAIENAILRRHTLPNPSTLLIGEPETASYETLQKAFSLLIHGESLQTREIPKPLAKAGAWVEDALPLGQEPFIKPWMIDIADDHLELDISRAKQTLDWEPKRRLLQSVPVMIQHLKDDPLRWYQLNKLEPPSWLKARRTA